MRMRIPFSIILDELNLQYTYHLDEHDHPQFEWAKLLVPKESTPSKNFLHVCTLSEALEYSSKVKGFYYLCIRDRIADESETEEALRGMVIINENLNLRELFNRVQKIFIKINNWIMLMQQSIVQNKGIQDLLDLSEPIIQNYVHILDPTFKVLAYTKNMLFDDPIVTEVVQFGYLSERSIKKIQNAGIYKLYKKTDDIIINKEQNVCDYATIERTFRYKGTYTIQVVMVFCNREFSNGQVELFKILTDYIKIYVDKFYSEQLTSCPATSLLTDIIEGKTKNIKEIEQRAEYVNIPFHSQFNLFNITFSDYKNIPEKRVAQEISEILFTSTVINYQEYILALNIYENGNLKKKINNNIRDIKTLLNRYEAFCGVSNVFANLSDLQKAYKQTKIAIQFGKKFFNKKTPPWKVPEKNIDQERFFFFDDHIIYWHLDKTLEAGKDIMDNSFAMKALSKLNEYDEENNLEYMKILYYYLLYERRASDVGKKLNMHRNNVVYHINKITKLIDNDLSNPFIRLRLLLEYYRWELLKKG